MQRMFLEKLDRHDLAILSVLQTEGRLSNRELADRIGLSSAPCWRRVKRLEDEGYIEAYSALVNLKKIGLKLLAFTEVFLDNHYQETLESLNEVVMDSAEILECHSVSGQCDYLLKIVTADMESFQLFLSQKLLQVKGIRSTNTLFSLTQPKLSKSIPFI
jgi:DNA-binding Lrp family transcriptional regulator